VKSKRRRAMLAISPRTAVLILGRLHGGQRRRESADVLNDSPAERLRDALLMFQRARVPDPQQLRRTRVSAPHRTGMDITWLTDRIAVGGGIWSAENMAKLAGAGVTHIIDMQIEFDDTPLAAEQGIEVLWNPTDDDFGMKPASLFQRGVNFAYAALAQPDTKLFIHCAAGVHRAPMMALALLGSMGWELNDAMELIELRRPVADFADVYVRSVEEFLGSGDSGSGFR
jgi:dual specificity protein phosphatase-like protein